MHKGIRFFSPAIATAAAVAIAGLATLSGTAAEERAVKGDRFALAGDLLCEGQEWPKLSSECLAWKSGEAVEGKVRYITKMTRDDDAFSTTLTRSVEIVSH